jgi:Tetratricopeptide repeat
MLAVLGRYSLATVTPTTIGVHRLVQAVIQARLGEESERHWAEVAVGLLRASFPNKGSPRSKMVILGSPCPGPTGSPGQTCWAATPKSWEVVTWPVCERLLPHGLAAAGHAERLGVAGEAAGWLLDRASTYLRERANTGRPGRSPSGRWRSPRPPPGEADPKVAWRCDTLGRVLQDVGDLAGARVQYERALAIGEATLGPDHLTVATIRGNLGRVLGAPGGRRPERTQGGRLGTLVNPGQHRCFILGLASGSLSCGWTVPVPLEYPRGTI